MEVLIFGGLGYIGAQTSREAMDRGHTVTIVDDLSNSSRETMNQLKGAFLYSSNMDWHIDLVQTYDAVINLAAKKSVTESFHLVNDYVRTNYWYAHKVKEACKKYGVNYVYASSAAVYGNRPVEEQPLTTDSIIAPESPYGMTKALIEQDAKDWGVGLRYFNVAGAGRGLGEEYGKMGNFIPRIYQQENLQLRQNPDGSYPVRDYVDVMDVARINVDMAELGGGGIYNIASGVGTSVLELVELAGREDYEVVRLQKGEPTQLIGSGDFELEYDIQDIIQGSADWYKSVKVF